MPDNLAGHDISAKNRTQATAGLIVQQYCLAVLQQPKIDLSSLNTNPNWPKLKAIQDSANQNLEASKSRAKSYLSTTQPKLITNITNIDNYFTVQRAIANLPKDAPESTWKSAVQTVLNQVDAYKKIADEINRELISFGNDLSTDSAAFAQNVTDLNALVDGDNGILDNLKNQISDIKSKIDGTIAGMVLSGLAIVAGGILIAVGAATEIFTGGASTAAVVGGIALVGAGIGGMATTAYLLSKFNSELGSLYAQQFQLQAEVTVLQHSSSELITLQQHATSAATAAASMANAWGLLSGDLQSIYGDLGLTLTVPALYSTWVTAAQDIAQNGLQTDITTIKQQMTGVTSIALPEDQTMSEWYNDIGKQARAA